MRIALTGATGFVGSGLTAQLLEDGHSVVAISRRAEEHPSDEGGRLSWSTLEQADFSGCDAVVHLAGEPIFPGRWTAEKKKRIVDSRVEGTRQVVQKMSECASPPAVLISASGVGFYGERVDEPVTESSPPGDDFLAQLCVDWEAAADAAKDFGCRVVQMRLGIVVGPDGGALKTMAPIFRWGIGGPLGSGKQPLPWIDRRDVVAFIQAALTRVEICGPVNLVTDAPQQKEFARLLGKALKRPAFLPAPGFSLKLILGEGASSILGGQNAIGERLAEWGCSPTQTDLLASLKASV